VIRDRRRADASASDTVLHEVVLARLPRYTAPEMLQHVIQRGNNRSVLFVAESDYKFFGDCFAAACERHGCRVHAYVFMTNHVHLLVTPTGPSGIAKVMQSVGRRYVQRFNSMHQRTGTLWEGRYKATLVDTEQYLWACYRYIELNPVRAGLVEDPRAYRWSSYRANAFGASDPLVTPRAQYDALDRDAHARQSSYRALFGEALSDSTLGAIRGATNGGWALGSKRFRDETALLLARRTEPARRGRRPRKNDENRV
jgi:putative transposase